MLNNDDIALMYLAEQTSPEDYKLSEVEITEKLGATWVSFVAILHSFDVMNRNRRIYDSDNTWNAIINNERIQDALRKRGWFGEMDHPGQDFTNMALTAERVQKIQMGNRSHAILNPRRQNNLLIANIETCPGTEAGLGMARDIVRGLVPSFSCRSIATMKNRNNKPYVDVRKLITYDWVLYPSHREAEMITKPMVNTQKITLESVCEHLQQSSFFDYSKDFCVPINEFVDFKEFLCDMDKNVSFVIESGDMSLNNITGFDPATKNVIIESAGSKIFVNTSIQTKKKVEDFLTSF